HATFGQPVERGPALSRGHDVLALVVTDRAGGWRLVARRVLGATGVTDERGHGCPRRAMAVGCYDDEAAAATAGILRSGVFPPRPINSAATAASRHSVPESMNAAM